MQVKLESKRRHFSSSKNRYGHGRTGRTVAAGPVMNYSSLGQLSGCEYCNSGIPIRPFASLVGALSTAGGRNVCDIHVWGGLIFTSFSVE